MPPTDPFTFDPSSFDQANQNLQSSFEAVGNAVSPASLDTAAARVRARLANVNRGAVNTINQAGTRNVGATNALLNNQRETNQNALATGLADVQQNFTNQLLAAAQAQAGIAGQQGNLASTINQTGLGFNQFGLNQELGTRAADLGDAQLTETTRANQQQELLDFFREFASSGATKSSSDAFNKRFQDLISQLFGTQGLDAGEGDKTKTPQIPAPAPAPTPIPTGTVPNLNLPGGAPFVIGG